MQMMSLLDVFMQLLDVHARNMCTYSKLMYEASKTLELLLEMRASLVSPKSCMVSGSLELKA